VKLTPILVFAAIAAAVPASAQLEPEAHTGSRIAEAPQQFPTDQTREILQRFAECAVKKFPQLAHQMVLDATKVTVGEKYMKVADPDCLVQATSYQFGIVQLKMSPDSFRSAVADELMKRNLSSFDPAQIAAAASLPEPSLDPADYVPKPGSNTRWKQEDYDKAKQRDTAAIWLFDFGECAARANPAEARNLLQTKINSDEELQALRAMMPAFSSCLDRGHKLSTERASLRGTIALNYYRLAFAPKVPQPEKQK
jgi:hypothetical protein